MVFVHDDSAIVAGQVWAHISVNGTPITIISLWTLAADHVCYMDWNRNDNPVYIETENIIDAAIWTMQTANIVRTVVPPSVVLRRR